MTGCFDMVQGILNKGIAPVTVELRQPCGGVLEEGTDLMPKKIV